MMTAEETPRVWVGCLGCYNGGELIGKWVDALEAADLTAADLGLKPDGRHPR